LETPRIEYSAGGSIYNTTKISTVVPNWIVLHLQSGAKYTLVRNVEEGTDGLLYLPAGFSKNNGIAYLIYSLRGKTTTAFVGTNKYQFLGNKTLSVDENGQRIQTFNYDVNNRLTSITNLSGKTVLLAYNSLGLVSSVTDPSGTRWDYGYDANRNLVSVRNPGLIFNNVLSYPLGVRTYFYEDAVNKNLLTGFAIDGVRQTRYAYDASKRVTKSGYENGEEYETFTYGASTTTVTDRRQQPVQYDFATLGTTKLLTKTSRKATVSCPLSAASQTYDAKGLLTSVVDFNGTNLTTLKYDTEGRLIQNTSKIIGATSASETKSEYTWYNWQVNTKTDFNSANQAILRTSYSYSHYLSGRTASWLTILTVTDLRTNISRVTRYSYTFHPSNSLATRTITRELPSVNAATGYPYNASTVYSYDTSGNLISVTNPLGQQVTYSLHNGLGLPGRKTDINGVTTDFTYDRAGNLLTSAQNLPSGARTTAYKYDGSNQVTKITFPDGRISQLQYNTAGRLTAAGNALSEFVNFNLDTANNIRSANSLRNTASFTGASTAATAGGNFSTSTAFDSLDRPWVKSGNNGQKTTYTYDGNGNVVAATNAAGTTTYYVYDGKNRLTDVRTSSSSSTTRYFYDADGRLTAVFDPRGLVTSYLYNAFGQVIKQTSPDTGVTSYTYDIGGRMTSQTRANGVATTYTYDALDRMTSRTASGVTETFTYDEGTYGKGRLTRINDATGSTAYEYSAPGELVKQVSTIYGAVYTTSWSYDAAGRLTGMTYPSGFSLTYSYELGPI
jgi:YD repeat-containing protein